MKVPKVKFDEEDQIRDIPNRTDLDKLKQQLDDVEEVGQELYYDELIFSDYEEEYYDGDPIDDEPVEQKYPEPLPLKRQVSEYEDIRRSDFNPPVLKNYVCPTPRMYSTRNFWRI